MPDRMSVPRPAEARRALVDAVACTDAVGRSRDLCVVVSGLVALRVPPGGSATLDAKQAARLDRLLAAERREHRQPDRGGQPAGGAP